MRASGFRWRGIPRALLELFRREPVEECSDLHAAFAKLTEERDAARDRLATAQDKHGEVWTALQGAKARIRELEADAHRTPDPLAMRPRGSHVTN
jgi:hypothetical protein